MEQKIFIGITRFSVYAPKSVEWVASKETSANLEKTSNDDYKKYLFSAERLDIRCFIFFELSLPILEVMSKKHNYKHIIQYSAELPEEYKRKLSVIEKKYPFIYLDLIDNLENRTSKLYKTVVPNLIENSFEKTNQKDKENITFGIFNLDDDDLLGINFLNKMAEYIDSKYSKKVISFGLGVTAFFDEASRLFSNPREAYLPKINIGLMRVCEYILKERKIIFPKSGSYMTVDKVTPVILDSREISYFWVRSFNQDTVHDKEESKAVLTKFLNQYPSLELNRNLLDTFLLEKNLFEPIETKPVGKAFNGVEEYFHIQEISFKKKASWTVAIKIFELENNEMFNFFFGKRGICSLSILRRNNMLEFKADDDSYVGGIEFLTQRLNEIVVTYDNGTFIFYNNGNISKPIFHPSSARFDAIGSGYDGTKHEQTSIISHVLVFQRALNIEEISQCFEKEFIDNTNGVMGNWDFTNADGQ
jgi:hypothetical protein